MNSPPQPSRPSRELIHENALPFCTSVDAFDVQEARRSFSTLFDRAAEAVFRAGYDLDDVTVDRFVVQRSVGGTETEAEFVAWLRANQPRGYDPVIALRVRVFLERLA